MKYKGISRSVDEYTRGRSQDRQMVFRNFDPILRPMERAVEYQRALTAAKLDKGAMDNHRDGISCMAKNPNHLKGIFSASMDGDIRLWDIASRRTVCQFPSHQGAVRGLTASTDGNILVSCGTDCTVRLWNVPRPTLEDFKISSKNFVEPSAVYVWKNAFWDVDHQFNGDQFATAGAQLDIWNHVSDRSITIYDLRMSSAARKMIMMVNEDGNCYSYDCRKFDEAKCVHEDHVSAVMDIDFSPTGREFVTGSYDRSVRIFPYNGGHSREMYHTKRMQRVFCVKYSSDATYVISGSDDTNLRLWKAKASEQLGVNLPRERKKHEYNEAVKERYRHLHEIKRIVRHKHVPKAIHITRGLIRTMNDSKRRKEERIKAHSASGSIVKKPLRKRNIIKLVE